MADQLASPEDLASAVNADVDTASATLAIECATAVVQAACGGRRIVRVVDDTEEVWGGTGQVLRLKNWPIVSIGSVTYNGSALTEGTASGTWRRAKYGIWRDCGWVEVCGEPLPTDVVYTHGYDPDGSDSDKQALQLGRGVSLGLAKGLFQSPDGVVLREQIDDYQVAYAEAEASLDMKPGVKALLRKQYGPKARMVGPA
jgi:hypothetical protein